jgi:parallel beta-helix repeat protein
MSLQSLVDTHPQGTTFCLSSGVYRLTIPLSVKSDDAFIGAQGAIVSGARTLASWTSDGNYWVATQQTQESTPVGTCEASYTGCQYNEELYRDNRSLWQVTSLSDLSSGEFYFDYANDKIYVADDPSGHKMEASVATKAIYGEGAYGMTSGVKIKGLIFEKFSNPAGNPVAGASTNGLFEGNEVRLNHGAGVGGGSGGLVLNNYIHDNGQMGVMSNGTTGAVFRNNEIAFNNTDGFSIGWEAGGGKFVGTTSLTFDGNYSHDNRGEGIWTDTNNINTVFSHNRIVHNYADGIAGEASYDAKIFGNVIRANGLTGCGCWGAGVLLVSSSNHEIYNNEIDSNQHGIVLQMDDRGSGKYGKFQIDNDYVHDNVITMPSGWTGMEQNVGDDSYFTSHGNRFESNSYHLSSMTAKQFAWMDQSLDKSGWTGYGQDTKGSFHTL